MYLLFFTLLEDENDKEYIVNLYQRYYPIMKQKGYSIVNDYEVVEDLIQDAFLKLIPKITLLRSLNSYKATSYIVYTMKHICLDYIRKKTRQARQVYVGSSDDVAESIPNLHAATAEDSYVQNEELEALEKALLQLSERDRNLLYFKYNMELSDKEIEGLLNIPAQHVRQYISRARRRAFHILSEGGGGAG